MRRSRLWLVLGLVVLTAPAEAKPGVAGVYEVVDLGPGQALAINDRGEVVGSLGASGHAVVWRTDGTHLDLHEAAGWPTNAWSNAYGINRHGEIVAMLSEFGTSPPTPPESQTFYVDWDRRTGTVEAVAITTELSPGDINNHGAIVGGEMGGAYLWTLKDGRIGLRDDGVANAVRINDHGQVLGVTSGAFVPEYPNGMHYVIRERDGSLTHVAFFEMTPPPPFTAQIGDINNRGQVVYTVTPTATPTTIGKLWNPDGTVTDYEGLMLRAINDHGLMAGRTRLLGSLVPVVLDETGDFVQLPAPAGWSGMGAAMDVNNRGEIAGWLNGPDGTHAVKWLPSK